MAEAALTPDTPVRPPSKRRQRILRWLPRISAALGVLLALLWWGIHRFDWLGPLVANSLRAVIGTDNVASLEDWVYSVEDRKNRLLHEQDKPKAYWTVPPPHASAAPPVASSSNGVPALPPFHPKDPGPALKSWSAP